MKINIVGEYNNLFDIALLRADLFYDFANQVADNEQCIAIQTGNRVIKYYYPIGIDGIPLYTSL